MAIEKIKVARRNAKDTVFTDLFSIPKYQLQLFQALHPEITDVTEDDITLVSLNPIILNDIYNDLGIVVKNKLLIIVEAQSTWSINILIRILMYLASTYHDYIIDNKLYVYGADKVEIPEPEFYVIYTGNRKFEKDTISLREDFWGNPDAKVDLIAKVIYAENKADIIGQYIIFCHVFDEQRKIYGYKKIAVEETIRICQNLDVLKSYLETRKKEVIDIMFLLFDQDYNMGLYMEHYGNEREQKGKIEGKIEGKLEGKIEGKFEGKIEGIIMTCKELGSSIKDAINMIAKKFSLPEDKAAQYVHEFWQN